MTGDEAEAAEKCEANREIGGRWEIGVPCARRSSFLRLFRQSGGEGGREGRIVGSSARAPTDRSRR